MSCKIPADTKSVTIEITDGRAISCEHKRLRQELFYKLMEEKHGSNQDLPIKEIIILSGPELRKIQFRERDYLDPKIATAFEFSLKMTKISLHKPVSKDYKIIHNSLGHFECDPHEMEEVLISSFTLTEGIYFLKRETFSVSTVTIPELPNTYYSLEKH